jgi:hypothetical protein
MNVDVSCVSSQEQLQGTAREEASGKATGNARAGTHWVVDSWKDSYRTLILKDSQFFTADCVCYTGVYLHICIHVSNCILPQSAPASFSNFSAPFCLRLPIIFFSSTVFRFVGVEEKVTSGATVVQHNHANIQEALTTCDEWQLGWTDTP